MPHYRYKASSPGGEVETGEIEADQESAVVERLQKRGLIPIRIETTARAGSALLAPSLPGRRAIGDNQVAEFSRDAATLLRAGLPLDRTLEILIGLARSSRLRALLTRIRDDVRGGTALSVALEAHPDVFSRFYVGMIRAGEAGGTLGKTLARISELMERAKELRETISSALIYPAILVAASVTSVMLLMFFVVPQFSELFAQSGATLPLATRIVIGAGNALRDYGWAALLALLLGYRLFRWKLGFPATKFAWDQRMLRLPLLGDLIAKLETARFARTLGILLGNGVPLLEGLRIVGDTVGNSAIASGLAAAGEQLKAGKGLSSPLSAQGIFPPLAVHMIGIGEETGSLEEMLGRIADVYDREVAAAVKRMLAFLEPVLILGLGLLIGGIIISILLAVLELNSLAG